MPLVELFDFIFKPLIGGAVAFFWWKKKKDTTTLEDYSTRIVKLEENVVTESRVREIFREEFLPAKEDLVELKALVQSQNAFQNHMMTELAEERGFRRGQSETNRN